MDEQTQDVKQLVADAVAKFREDFVFKSYSERHPEIGKMVNCPVCLRRHRGIIKCEQQFATGTHDPAPEGEKVVLIANQNTRKGVYGAAQFAKKRVRPHHSAALLQLVELTQQLFSKYYPRISDPEKAMQAARGEALQILRRKRRAFRQVRNNQQYESRRINRSL